MYSWIIILAICIWVIWYFDKQRIVNANEPKNTPLEILKSRFASGELTEEEYEERRAVLEEDEYFDTYP